VIPDIWILYDPINSTYISTSDATQATDWVLQQDRIRKERERREREQLYSFVQYANPAPREPEPVVYERWLPWWFFDRDLQRQNPKVRAGHPRRFHAEARRDCSGRVHRRPPRTAPSSWKTLKRRMNRGTMHKERRS
jgi:hypothetical protein